MKSAGRPLSIPVHAHPLVRLLYQELINNRISLQTVSTRAGLGRNTVDAWRHRHNPNLIALEAALNVVGYELVAVPIEHKRA